MRQALVKEGLPSSNRPVWSPPGQGCYKLNSEVDGLAKCGGATGTWLIGFTKAIDVCFVVKVELWGIYIGLL
ncbi:hypothetical protein GQ457_08G018610 [Hibiscus cannabinus]